MEVVITQLRTITVDKTATKHVEKCRKAGVCLSCEKLKGRLIRGNCIACNRATLRAIAAGYTTEAQRVGLGRLLPKATPGRKPSNPVTVETRSV